MLRGANCEMRIATRGWGPSRAGQSNGIVTAGVAEDAEEPVLCALCDRCGAVRSPLAVRSWQLAVRSCFSGRPMRRPVVIELQLRLGLERDEKAEREVPER